MGSRKKKSDFAKGRSMSASCADMSPDNELDDTASVTDQRHSICVTEPYFDKPTIDNRRTASDLAIYQAGSRRRSGRRRIPHVVEEVSRGQDSDSEEDEIMRELMIRHSPSPRHSYEDGSGESLTSSHRQHHERAKSYPFHAFDVPETNSTCHRSDILHSPSVSPLPWQQGSVPSLVVTSTGEATTGNRHLSASNNNLLSVPDKIPRKQSSGSLTSPSESESEPSPPPIRRLGRRRAIFDSKPFGVTSSANISPEHSPANSCDEETNSSSSSPRLRSRRSRRRSSADDSVLPDTVGQGEVVLKEHPRKNPLLKRNTIADFAAVKPLQPGLPFTSEPDKTKIKGSSFSLLKLIDKKSKQQRLSLTDLDDVLKNMKISEFTDTNLAHYKDLHWSELIASRDKQGSDVNSLQISEIERKRREVVWELFQSECTFLFNHLVVLKHCFMEPLKRCQVEGHLMYAEPQELFGNIDELCYVSYTFCRDFLTALQKDMSATKFGSTDMLVKAFQKLSQHSKDGEVYHTYCLHYPNAIKYLEQLQKRDSFNDFERRVEQDPRCNRLKIKDLLIAPLQHCTKKPLLLANIRKYTEDPDEREQLSESLSKLETSLQNLEEKMKWVKNMQRVQEIQQQIVWQPITEMDTRTYIPDFLKPTLSKQPCEKLLETSNRQLIFEGPLTLIETAKTIDMYLFLFDDILLLTKIKQRPRKQKQSTNERDQGVNQRPQTEGAIFVVYRQPVALDRFSLHDISTSEASASGLKHSFVLVQISRFQQIIGVYTLQAATDVIKSQWLQHLEHVKKKYKQSWEHDDTKQDKAESPTSSIRSKKSQSGSIKSQQSDKTGSLPRNFREKTDSTQSRDSGVSVTSERTMRSQSSSTSSERNSVGDNRSSPVPATRKLANDVNEVHVIKEETDYEMVMHRQLETCLGDRPPPVPNLPPPLVPPQQNGVAHQHRAPPDGGSTQQSTYTTPLNVQSPQSPPKTHRVSYPQPTVPDEHKTRSLPKGTNLISMSQTHEQSIDAVFL
ncbi:unnamed protein product [Owenia fusiformis]|uniref:Pleckstrin homology domain-containing family G member 7 n=1 Tax=Owenia fusiformis TaxID=6347 RepID=A0A8S4NN42_OWEFU|nr:unnamed protein product [Owenia fusiformis]